MKNREFKKLFIFTGSAAILIAAVNVLVYVFVNRLDPTVGFNAEVLSGITRYLMVILPIGLSFITAKHITNLKEYVKSFIWGSCSILTILLVHLISMVLIVQLAYPDAITVPLAYVYSFFSMLAGFLTVYAASLLAAALFDNAFKRLSTLILILFLPTALSLVFQFPIYETLIQNSVAGSGIVSINASASGGLFTFPSFYTFSGTNLSVSQIFSGPTGLTNICNIVYNYILTVSFFSLGFFITVKKIKLDKYELCTDIICVLMFFPVMFVSMVAAGESFISVIAAIVLYVLIVFLLRGSFTFALRNVMSLALCSAIACGTYFGLLALKRHSQSFIEYSYNQIESLTAYVPSPDLICTEKGLTKLYEVKITDKNIISSVLKTDRYQSESQRGNMPYDDLKIVLKTSDGERYETFFDLTNDAAQALYSYIDTQPDVLEQFEQIRKKPIVASCLRNNDGAVSVFNSEQVDISAFRTEQKSFERLLQTEKLKSEIASSLARYYLGYEPYVQKSYENSVIAVYRYFDGSYYVEYNVYPGKEADSDVQY